MPKADAYTTTTLLGLPAHAEAPEPEGPEPPRRGLRGYRCAHESEPGSGSGLGEDTATPAERARFRRDQARQMVVLALEGDVATVAWRDHPEGGLLRRQRADLALRHPMR